MINHHWIRSEIDGGDLAAFDVGLEIVVEIRIREIRAVRVQSKGQGVRQQCRVLRMRIQAVKELVLLFFALVVVVVGVVIVVVGNRIRVRVPARGATASVRA